ncbi:MAG: vitamin K epoxide reductase family protein [Aeoliella sp.]
MPPDPPVDDITGLNGRSDNRALIVAAILATGLSLWLAVQTQAGNNIPGCGSGSGCASVLYTRWGQWFGVPVSVVATAAYSLVLVLTLIVPGGRPGDWRHRLWLTAQVVLATTILAAIMWFVALQVLHLRAICKYCMVNHAVGALAAILLLRQWRSERRNLSTGYEAGLLPPLLVTSALMGVLLAGQLLGPLPDTHALSQYHFGGGRIRVAKDEAPVWGNPDAKYVFLELFDYSCTTCREMAHLLIDARERYGGQLAVVLVPCPIERKCNPHLLPGAVEHENACDYACCGMAVWLAAPEQFGDFHEWLILTEPMPTLSAARARAENLVGSSDYGTALKDARIDRLLARGVDLYRLQEQGPMPKLIVGNRFINGAPRSSEALFEALESISPIRPLVAE